MENVSYTELRADFLDPRRSPNGPITTARLKRSRNIYLALCLIGVLPTLLSFNAPWQAFGWGLWFPGAGFIAVGGWWFLATLLTGLLFALSLVAWFGSGMNIAPVIVWFGAAATASFAADATVWTGTFLAIPILTLTGAVALSVMNKRSVAKQKSKLEQRGLYYA